VNPCPKCGTEKVRQELIDGGHEYVCLTCKNTPPKKKRGCKHTKKAKADMGTAMLATPQGFVWIVDAACLSCGAWDLSSEYDERWHGWHHPRELAALDEVEVGS
jgi:hypothetical protein